VSAEPLVVTPTSEHETLVEPSRPPVELARERSSVAKARVQVSALHPHREADWDRYVLGGAPGAGFFHQLGWRWLVERCFGHRAHYLTAVRQGRLAGALPLFEMKSRLFGHSLVSVPFAIGGGIAADDGEAARALLDEACALADRLGVDYLELRSEEPLVDARLVTKDLYVTFRADLGEPEEALLKRMERKRRQMMSYVGRAGFETRVAGLEELPLFYRLFSLSMRRHGTPVYPRLFLQEILDRFPGRTNLFFVSHGGRTVAGVLNLLFGDVVMPFYAGSVVTDRPRGVDDFLYLSILRWGRDHGYRTFDFGRSKKGTGPWKFKGRWGMEEVPLDYQYHLAGAAELPNVSPANPKYQRLIEVWRHLPLKLTQWIGPRVIRRIP
jgi:FemAB-related protein (PEP-CTERM system-associated)